MADFAKLEDMLGAFTTDLELRGFVQIPEKKGELARYSKKGSLIAFEVGIEEDYRDLGELKFNHIYLNFACECPENLVEIRGSELLPSCGLMHAFFRSNEIYHHAVVGEQELDGKKMILPSYHIGFEKGKILSKEMQNVLREAVDYMCNCITANVVMLHKTKSFE